MNRITYYTYDAPGICPECGAALRPVRLYRAEDLALRDNPKSTYWGGRTVTTVTTSHTYRNIAPCVLGYCERCKQADDEKRQAALGSTKPSPAKWIAGLCVMLAGMIALALLAVFDVTASLAIFAAVAAIVAGFCVMIKGIDAYRPAHRDYVKYHTGYRDPYKSPSDETLADLTAMFASGSGVKYLSEKELKELRQKQFGF